MSNLSPEAIALLRKAVDRALTVPEGFDMKWWVVRSALVPYTKPAAITSAEVGILVDPLPPCGTVGCLLFELEVANGLTPEEAYNLLRTHLVRQTPIERGAALLGVSYGQALVLLCGPTTWPSYLRDEYRAQIPFTTGRALVLQKAVEEWIANDGKFSLRFLRYAEFVRG